MAKTIRPVPFLDLRAQIRPLRAELDAAMASVVDQTAFILSDHLTAFERDFAAFCEVKHCIGVDSGTQALHLILRTLGVGPGDEVITVPNTFIATLEAIHYTGARPVLVDVDPDTWLMDPRAVARAIGPRTRAILPVHLFGHPAPMSELRTLADQAGVALVEDACQAHGARYPGAAHRWSGPGGGIQLLSRQEPRRFRRRRRDRHRRRRARGALPQPAPPRPGREEHPRSCRLHRPARFAAGGGAVRQAAAPRQLERRAPDPCRALPSSSGGCLPDARRCSGAARRFTICCRSAPRSRTGS